MVTGSWVVSSPASQAPTAKAKLELVSTETDIKTALGDLGMLSA